MFRCVHIIRGNYFLKQVEPIGLCNPCATYGVNPLNICAKYSLSFMLGGKHSKYV